MAVYLLTIDTLTIIIIVRQRWSWFWLYNGHEKLPIVRTNWDFLPPFADAARCLSSLQGCSHHHLDQHHRHCNHHQRKNSFDKITKCSTPSSIKRDHGGHNAKFYACLLACYLVLPVEGGSQWLGKHCSNPQKRHGMGVVLPKCKNMVESLSAVMFLKQRILQQQFISNLLIFQYCFFVQRLYFEFCKSIF